MTVDIFGYICCVVQDDKFSLVKFYQFFSTLRGRKQLNLFIFAKNF